MAEVTRLGGPSDWALPYWNYSASSAAARLPAAFRNPTLSDGSTNHLFVAQRDPDANAGRDFATAAMTDVSVCLSESSFQSAGGSAGFGGRKTAFNHAGGAFGTLEGTPHGRMHVAVSGPSASGFMGSFTRAPLDPIFWLHHSNIDRLWEVWLQRDSAHQNPTTSDWLTSVSFDFHDASGSPVSMTPSQVLSTRAAPLSYEYDDISDPLGP
jgi:tyrosinase